MRRLAILLLAGCAPGTEVVVSVDTKELVAPDDFQKLCITVTNPPGTTPIYQSQDLIACPPGASAGCFRLPVTVDLTPGPMQPDAKVRVEVDALPRDVSCQDTDAATHAVTSDASVFTFTSGQSQKLDFFLYRQCLNVNCALADRVCSAEGRCVTLEVGGNTVEPDLASLPNDLGNGTVVLGESQNLPYEDPHSPGTANASPYVAHAGTVRSISFLLNNNNISKFLFGLYDDVSGHPGRLLTQGTVDNPTPFVTTWFTASVPPLNVTTGSTYWLVVLAPANDPGHSFSVRYLSDVNIPTITEHSKDVTLSVLPASWQTGASYANTSVSAYASE